jgi:uncharacterized protein (DUF934 family)
MATLIKHRKPAADSWQRLDRDIRRWVSPGEDGFVPDFPRGADLIVPLALWRLRRDDLLHHTGGVGLWLDAGDDPEAIAPDLHRLDLVAIDFPKFSDGRGFSTARLLRERYGFAGELRAIGDVGRDQLAFLERSGFDAFALRDGVSATDALAAFDEVSVVYQPDARARVPQTAEVVA